ncbi:MAG: hypothetical protein ACI8RU_000892 [Zhongshania aliphaticivorans]|uniref:DUF2971 domain-containing protein n=1 Tax=Zhongshania aliphaticivorans TaxID=1470434 RepID=UPI0039E53CCB
MFFSVFAACAISEIRRLELPYFHYTSIEGIKGIIESREMWASHVNFLNDQKEWIYFDEILTAAVNELDLPFHLDGAIFESREDLRKALLGYPSSRINSFDFVLSFSSVGDCKSQWQEYCPKFAGYALEFSESPILAYGERAHRLFETDDDDLVDDETKLTRCIYDRQQQVEMVKAIIKENHKRKRHYVGLVAGLLSGLRCQFKHPGFSEESECRWYGRADGDMHLRAKNGIMVPYVKVPIDITKLSAIWVGPSPVQDRAVQGLSFWWSVLQRDDSAYIYENDQTGVIRLDKSGIPYSFI